jgi:primosomal replication protein N
VPSAAGRWWARLPDVGRTLIIKNTGSPTVCLDYKKPVWRTSNGWLTQGHALPTVIKHSAPPKRVQPKKAEHSVHCYTQNTSRILHSRHCQKELDFPRRSFSSKSQVALDILVQGIIIHVRRFLSQETKRNDVKWVDALLFEEYKSSQHPLYCCDWLLVPNWRRHFKSLLKFYERLISCVTFLWTGRHHGTEVQGPVIINKHYQPSAKTK